MGRIAKVSLKVPMALWGELQLWGLVRAEGYMLLELIERGGKMMGF